VALIEAIARGGAAADQLPTSDKAKVVVTVEPLDVGRTRRLVTKGLRTALWQRDHWCSVPGCTSSPQWTDAHHVRPWWQGGRTSLLNLAMLCRRHHTHGDRHDLTAAVTTPMGTGTT
jgi:hypothetical protein